MAEARSAVSEPRVVASEEDHYTNRDFYRAWKKSIIRRLYRTRNLILNGMWPTSVYNLGVGVACFSVGMIGDWPFLQPVNSCLWSLGRNLHIHEGIPYYVRVLLISSVGGLCFFVLLMYKRRWLLRVLLSYHRWMYEAPRTESWSTVMWAAVVRLVSGYHPTMASYQKSLPTLPVPSLDHTLTQFVASVKPLYGEDSEEFAKIKKDAKEFRSTLGPKLQRILVLKSWWSENWVTDWWEKYIYLMSRTPIAVNSNYYILDHGHWCPTSRQVSRAACAVYNYLDFKHQVDTEQLEPLVLRKTVPLCMAQYYKAFSTTRIPGVDEDELMTFTDSQHIIVSRLGLHYVVQIHDSRDNPLSVSSLEKQLQWIINDADRHTCGCGEQCERHLASLTALDRTEWARTRTDYFSSGVNQHSLHLVESAIFHVVLETKSFKTWSERGSYMLHGEGSAQWFDKSFNLVFFADARMALNCEHAWGDAPVMGHVSEFHFSREAFGDLYDEDGFCRPVAGTSEQAALEPPSRLVWDMKPHLEVKIQRALAFSSVAAKDLDLCVVQHDSYGKGFMKSCKVSPDAYIQAALQLTYYRQVGRFALTYEATMTRLYLLGRTETVRSLTDECAQFVRAMEDEDATNEERIHLLKETCAVHQKLYRDAMNGLGIDRHMFGLMVVCKGLKYESDFLRDSLMMPWTLSTSQQPQQQIASSPDCTQFKHKICPGGGFGPVSDQGYGVSYMVPGDHTLFFHISSKKSCSLTNSTEFADLLFKSLADMKEIFQ